MIPELAIARRYSSTQRGSFSAKLLKWMGTGGVAIGVFSLIVVLAVMRGFEGKFEEKIFGFQAHLTFEATGEARAELPEGAVLQQQTPQLSSWTQWLEGELIIQSDFGRAAGARVRGITEDADQLRGVEHSHFPTERGARLGMSGDELPGIVLGRELAATLEVHPDFRDEVKLIFPLGDIAPTGEILPRVRRFQVTGLFESGFYEYDHKYAVIDYAMAERMFGEYGRERVALYLKDPLQAAELKKKFLRSGLGSDIQLATWQERNKQLFEALRLERMGMFLLLMMIVLIASFNIFALVSMLVLEKVHDVAVLRTLGLNVRQVRRLFLLQSGGIGLKGALIGGLAGLAVCLWLTWFPYHLPPTYYVEFLPIRFHIGQIVVGVLMGPFIGLLVGLYPARQATRYSIAEVLRYE